MEKRGEGVSHFSVKSFWSKCHKFSHRNPLEVLYFRLSKSWCLRWLCHDFLSNIVLSHSTEKKLTEQFGVPEKIGYRKNSLQRRYHDFPLKKFVSQCRKNSEENLSLSMFDKVPVIQKFYWYKGEGGSIIILCRKFHVSVPTNFVWEPFSMSLFFGIEKFSA